jgi:hypothetical protein
LILDLVIEEAGHASRTTGKELDRVTRRMLTRMGIDPAYIFAGVYAIDRVPQSTKRYQTINTDAAPGRHWFAMSPDGGVYDSLQRNGDLGDVEQDKFEKNCGQRAIAWILLHIHDSELAMAL